MEILVGTVVKVFCQIVQAGAFHGSGRVEGESVSLSIGDVPVTYLRLVTAFLRTDVSPILVGYGLFVYAQTVAVITIDIVLARTFSVVFYCVVGLGHTKLHAVTEQGRAVLG